MCEKSVIVMCFKCEISGVLSSIFLVFYVLFFAVFYLIFYLVFMIVLPLLMVLWKEVRPFLDTSLVLVLPCVSPQRICPYLCLQGTHHLFSLSSQNLYSLFCLDKLLVNTTRLIGNKASTLLDKWDTILGKCT